MTNKKKSLFTTTIAATALLIGSTAGAGAGGTFGIELHGANVETTLGNCSIGPFPQTGKAGIYNGHCDEFTDAEKCLALLKQNISAYSGNLSSALDNDRVEYCLDVFKQGLMEPVTGSN